VVPVIFATSFACETVTLLVEMLTVFVTFRARDTFTVAGRRLRESVPVVRLSAFAAKATALLYALVEEPVATATALP